jgi:hypothetical protein
MLAPPASCFGLCCPSVARPSTAATATADPFLSLPAGRCYSASKLSWSLLLTCGAPLPRHGHDPAAATVTADPILTLPPCRCYSASKLLWSLLLTCGAPLPRHGHDPAAATVTADPISTLPSCRCYSASKLLWSLLLTCGAPLPRHGHDPAAATVAELRGRLLPAPREPGVMLATGFLSREHANAHAAWGVPCGVLLSRHLGGSLDVVSTRHSRSAAASARAVQRALLGSSQRATAGTPPNLRLLRIGCGGMLRSPRQMRPVTHALTIAALLEWRLVPEARALTLGVVAVDGVVRQLVEAIYLQNSPDGAKKPPCPPSSTSPPSSFSAAGRISPDAGCPPGAIYLQNSPDGAKEPACPPSSDGAAGRISPDRGCPPPLVSRSSLDAQLGDGSEPATATDSRVDAAEVRAAQARWLEWAKGLPLLASAHDQYVAARPWAGATARARANRVKGKAKHAGDKGANPSVGAKAPYGKAEPIREEGVSPCACADATDGKKAIPSCEQSVPPFAGSEGPNGEANPTREKSVFPSAGADAAKGNAIPTGEKNVPPFAGSKGANGEADTIREEGVPSSASTSAAKGKVKPTGEEIIPPLAGAETANGKKIVSSPASSRACPVNLSRSSSAPALQRHSPGLTSSPASSPNDSRLSSDCGTPTNAGDGPATSSGQSGRTSPARSPTAVDGDSAGLRAHNTKGKGGGPGARNT